MKNFLIALVLFGGICAAASPYVIWGIASVEFPLNGKVVDQGTGQIVSYTAPMRITAMIVGRNGLLAGGTAVVYSDSAFLYKMNEVAQGRSTLVSDCAKEGECNIDAQLSEKSTLKETRYVAGKFSDSFRVLPFTTLHAPVKSEPAITTTAKKTAEGLYSVLAEWKRSIDYVESFVPLYPLSKAKECSSQAPILVRKIELVQRERIAVSAKTEKDARKSAEASMRRDAGTLDEAISDKCPELGKQSDTGLLTIATLYRLAPEDPDLGASERAFKIFKPETFSATASANQLKVSYELNPLAEETSVKVYIVPDRYLNFFEGKTGEVFSVFLGMTDSEKACALSSSGFAELPSPEKAKTACFSSRTFAKPYSVNVKSEITDAGKIRNQVVRKTSGNYDQELLLSALKSATLQKTDISWDMDVGAGSVFSATAQTGKAGKLLPGGYTVFAEATDSAGTETLEQHVYVANADNKREVGQYLVKRSGTNTVGTCKFDLNANSNGRYWPTAACNGVKLDISAVSANPAPPNTAFKFGSTVAALTPICGDDIACPCTVGLTDCAFLTVFDSSVLGTKATS
ncbi:Uncharacterised protein [Candidatus Norongarragalina meridionalis]|nr:Uncharacterised protein [Candidatus Norongarragalina meridionalis]